MANKKPHRIKWYIWYISEDRQYLSTGKKEKFSLPVFTKWLHESSPTTSSTTTALVHIFTDQLLSNSFYSRYIFQGSQTVHCIQSHHYTEYRLLDFHTTLFSGIVSSLHVSFTNICYFPPQKKNYSWEIPYRSIRILTRTKIKANLGFQLQKSMPVLSMSWI